MVGAPSLMLIARSRSASKSIELQFNRARAASFRVEGLERQTGGTTMDMAASGCATDSSGSSEISSKENDCLTSQPTQGKNYTLISYLKANKSKFSWQGTFQQLLQFAEQHLGLTHELTKVSESETKKTIKTEQIILNWFCSTGTLQIQGSQATSCKTSILQLLNDKSETDKGNASRRPSHNVGTNETSVVLVDNLETEYPSDEAVTLNSLY